MTTVYPDGNQWRTVNIERFTLPKGRLITIPGGFPFDGHSIPPPFSFFINPFSADMRAALLHDYLYVRRKQGHTDITRSQADRYYLREMKLCGSNWLRRNTLYVGVRALGWIYWYWWGKYGALFILMAGLGWWLAW